MAKVPAPRDQWYVVHVLSGQESKVQERMLRLAKMEELGDVVFDVLVPEETVSEVKKGQRKDSKRKFFPGYVIVNCHLLDEDGKLVDRTWYFIKGCEGVLGFAGNKDRPLPMMAHEVENLLHQVQDREGAVSPKVSFEVGETVKVADGPFQSQNGVVEEIDPVRGRLRVSVTIFGRSTPVELEYWQVEKS